MDWADARTVVDPQDPNYDSGDDGSPVQFSLQADGPRALDSLPTFKQAVRGLAHRAACHPAGIWLQPCKPRLASLGRAASEGCVSGRICPDSTMEHANSLDRAELGIEYQVLIFS